jgi:PEP-CTERM motif
MKRLLTTTALVCGVALGGLAPAHATILFSPTGGSTGDVVQFESQFAGQTAFFGDVNQGATPVEFNTIAGALNGETGIGTNGKGQADIVCSTGCGTDAKGGANGMQLTDLEIKITGGFAVTKFIGNLDFGEGTANIKVTDQMGAVFNYTLGNGQNFFTLTAINNEVITDIQITESAPDNHGDFGWNDFKQPRVEGVCTLVGTTCTPVSTPEPASIALLGLGLLGTAAAASRKRR